ncbi:nucleotidyltransferase family protein [Xanthobacter tagetidis]|uniref:Nucleotidyltransferase family protein n=1 Tax=Xanthobacter tagetidis TaxID=60216 RepID=A0A3L7ADV0_9HYPH|nr:nucleotidyltransferase family protein [Xanthobacter tagetidis]MBB6309807.1 hypothetical protein [Xanthobacter tagetidis]RLP78165.1 hypothetical protein D9R14_12325 [Xanthobacter tagetidis]
MTQALGLTQRERALLVACLGSGAAARDAFAAWRPFASPADMHGRELRLMPLLLANLRREGIDDPILPWLKGQAKLIWLTGMMRQRALARALDALSAADIPVMLIKGAALLVRWPKAVETRPMGDFDLLVPPGQARAALDALIGAGWTGARGSQLSDDDLDRFHAVGLVSAGADGSTRGGTQIDLHWRAAEAIADPRHSEGLRARAVAARFDGRPVAVSGLADHLFVLLAHAFHDTVMQRYDWVAEAALLLEAGAPDAWDWPLFHDLCRRYGLEAWAVAALREVSAITARPLPDGADFADDVVAALRSRPPSSDAEAAADQALASLDLAMERVKALVGDPSRLAELGYEAIDLCRTGVGASMVDGWSVPAGDGRWSDGGTAILAFRAPRSRIGETVALRLWLQPYLATQIPRLNARAWAGAGVAHWSFVASDRDGGSRTVEGRVLDWDGVPVVVVAIRFDALMSGAERRRLGLDHRRIGLLLSQMAMTCPEAAPVIETRLALRDPGADLVAWSGWGAAGERGRWTVGEEAVVHVRLPAGKAVRAIRFEVPMVFCAAGVRQAITVAVNGTTCRDIVLPRKARPIQAGSFQGATFDVELPDGIAGGAYVEIRLRIAHPTVPADHCGSADTRRVGALVAALSPVRGHRWGVKALADRLSSALGRRRG